MKKILLVFLVIGLQIQTNAQLKVSISDKELSESKTLIYSAISDDVINPEIATKAGISEELTQPALTPPSLTTRAVSNITSTTATSGGNITSNGGVPLTARGICWSTTSNPTIANSKTSNGTETGTYTSNITGLNPKTTYFVRAYATNADGTSYGNEVSFTTDITVYAGADQTVCTDYVNLTAVDPGIYPGKWTVQQGTGSFVSPSSFTTRVNNLSKGINELVWNVFKDAVYKKDAIIITNNSVTANAGLDQTVCIDIANLNALPLPVGVTGVWTSTDPVIIMSPTDRQTEVNGLLTGLNTFTWTVTNKGCSASDNVKIISALFLANTEDNKSICSDTTTIWATPPVIGIGKWSLLSGTATIGTPNLNKSKITNIGAGENIFEWTISTNECGDIQDNLIIMNDPVVVVAGIDQTICTNIGYLSPTRRANGPGLWTLHSGTATIVSPDMYNSEIRGVDAPVVFKWKVTEGKCADSTYVKITPVKLTAAFTFTQNSKSLTFTNTSTGNNLEHFWAFGDGQLSRLQNPGTITYINEGSKTACLAIKNMANGCTDLACKTAMITGTKIYAKADYTFSLDQFKATFTDASQNAVSRKWIFDDGTTSTELNPVHTYLKPGFYNVELKALSSDSLVSTITKVVNIQGLKTEGCKALFTWIPKENGVHFTERSRGGWKKITWDFADGTNASTKTPVHLFQKGGYYEVALTIQDSTTNCFDTYREVVYVENQAKTEKVKSEFDWYNSGITNRVKFTSNHSGLPKKWYWDFGDNTPADSITHTQHTYATNGYYKACMTVWNETLDQDTRCKVIEAGDVSKSAYPQFSYVTDPLYSTVYFRNESLGTIVSYNWNFGDGTSSIQKNPGHAYKDTGYYAVCLTVTSLDGKSKTYCKDVRLGTATANPCLISCVWPGDANNDLEANHYDLLTLGLNYNMRGPWRENASTHWHGQYAQNWSTIQLTTGNNNKYSDCNGDGITNILDVEAIQKNFAYSHYLQPDRKDLKLPQWLLEWEWVAKKSVSQSGKVRLRRSSKKGLTDDNLLYGIGYEIKLTNDVGLYYSSIKIKFDQSWLGENGKNLMSFYFVDSLKHIIYIGMVRTDHTEITGEGPITTVNMEFKDGTNPSKLVLTVKSDNGGIRSSGNQIVLTGQTVGGIDEIDYDLKNITTYPNPANDRLNIIMPYEDNYNVQIYNLTGNQMLSAKISGNAYQLDVSSFQSGIYILKVMSNKGVYQNKFQVIR